MSYESYEQSQKQFPPQPGGGGGGGIPEGPLTLRGIGYDVSDCPGNPQSTYPTPLAITDFIITAPTGATAFEWSLNNGVTWSSNPLIDFSEGGGAGFVCANLGTAPINIRVVGSATLGVQTYFVNQDNNGVC